MYTPLDRPQMDSTKGDRWFQVVDAETNEIVKRLDIGQILEEHGHDDYSSAVRPMAVAPGERIVYMQLSFLHGFVEFDLEAEKPLRIAHLPVSEEAESMQREEYLLDSAHHGLAINPEGTKLCVAGTMSDYAAIVDRDTFEPTLFEGVGKPYWATNSADGRYCFVSASEDDEVVVLDYATESEVARFDVGDHPQRMRMGVIRAEYVDGATDRARGDESATGSGVQAAASGGASADQPVLPATGGGGFVLALVATLAGAGVAMRLRSRPR